MKRLILVLAVLLSTGCLFAQDMTGQWNGILNAMGQKVRIVFNISKTDSGYTSTMDSPDQGAKGLPTTSTVYENAVLKISMTVGNINYEGTLGSDGSLIGQFRQGAFNAPLTLTRNVPEKITETRPQDPVAPFPYKAEDVTFVNAGAGVTLAGTLTLPEGKGPFPAVVLISGSGPQDRNEEIFNHRPFWVIADYLTRKGIAVLRYDDRGVGKSTGDFAKANTPNLSKDVEAAVNFLNTRKDINPKKIGLIGHSEGGIIAPMIAATNDNIRFIVLMAGTGMNGKDLLLLQTELISKASGMPELALQKNLQEVRILYDLICKNRDENVLKVKLTDYMKQDYAQLPDSVKKQIGLPEDDFINQQLTQLTSPWFTFFVRYDPAPMLLNVKCPVFALNGSKDLQVPPRENLSLIKSNLEKARNKKVMVREYPGLNHLFQECTTGAPNEYKNIDQTISPQVLSDMTDWILQQVKK